MKSKWDHNPVGVFKLFHKLDWDNNRMLSREAFKFFSDELAENIGSRTFESIFTEMDVNQDKQISIAEFVQGIKNAGLQGEDFKPKERLFKIKNVQGRIYAVKVAEEGTVGDLLKALQDALDPSKVIGELLYQGEIQPKNKQLSKLDDTRKFSLTEKRTMHEPLTKEEHKIAKNLNLSKDDAEYLKSIFLGFDLNNDGKISKEELTSILRGLQKGKEPTKENINRIS